MRLTEAAEVPAEDSTEAEDEPTGTGAWEGVPTFTGLADFLAGEGVFVLWRGGGGRFSSPEDSSNDPPSVLPGLYLLPSVDDEDDDSFLFRGDGLGTGLLSLDFEEGCFSRSISSTFWRIRDALFISFMLSNISWARSSPEYVDSCGKRSNKQTYVCIMCCMARLTTFSAESRWSLFAASAKMIVSWRASSKSSLDDMAALKVGGRS